MNNLVFGKYIPIDSIVHRLDPRAKIVALFVMIVAIFIPKSWWAYLFLAVCLLSIILLAKLKLGFIFKAFKPMMFMMVFLLIVNCLTLKTGYVLISIGTFAIYSDAVFNTLFIVVRLLLMIMLTTCLTATTKPLDLTLGIEYLLSPLKVFHFPAHEVAMMISIALRFIPTIIEETMRIMNSQKSRGVDFEEGKLKEKIQAILSLIVPLFSVAFERAYELADAMEARGYIPGADRTRYRNLEFTFKDGLLILLSFIVLALMILSRIYL
ncbi:MAG: energy-coupling factor transporter transmembrane component T [Erysipelotrichaceae bacterium]|nr:energy-coupling factor transporter transmembrane component T [Erysipelotrichaceae bacterium]